MRPFKRIFSSALSVLSCMALLSNAPLPTEAKEFGGEKFESIIAKQYDWLFYCDMDVLESYMNYKGSQMNPIVRFTVYYKFTGHARRGFVQPPAIKY